MVSEKVKTAGVSVAGEEFRLCQSTDDIIDALSRAGEELEKGNIALIQMKGENYEVWTHKKV